MTQRFLASLAILTAMAGPAAAQEYTFKIGHTNAAGEVQDKGLEKMKELLEAKTDGAATLEIYPGGQLGDEAQLIEGVMLGSIDMSMTSNSLLSNYVEDYKVFDMLFLFPSIAGVGEKVDANWTMMEASANGAGFELLGVFSSGVRHLMTKKPVESMADLKGLKIRTMQNPAHVDTFKAFGANPTPLAYTELYGALETGVMDGAEAANTNFYAQKFYEVAPDWAMVGWLELVAPVIMGEAQYQALPDDIKTALDEAGKEAGAFQRAAYRESDAARVADIEAAGVTITHPEVQPFRDAAEGVKAKFLQSDGQKTLFELISKVE